MGAMPDRAEPPQPTTVDLPSTGPDRPDLTSAETLAPPPRPGGPEAPPAGSFGDYELLGEIERGGMGIVYRAREKHSGRLVALKMMLCGGDDANRQRFQLEARATGELNHPGIVAIHAWGEHDGRPFYTMDFVPGVPLGRLLQKGPLPAEKAVRYLVGIARAAAAAHQLGIVHRDLKPANVIVDPSDRPRVLDFGLAKRRRGDGLVPDDAETKWEEVRRRVAAAPKPLTETGAILGTPDYMAPEQVRAEHDRVGPPADVHALGAMFYEMLSGRPPFHADSTFETLMRVCEGPPAPLRRLARGVPATLEAVCRRCLEKDPRDRYPDAGTLADDLEARWQRLTQARRFARLTLAALLTLILLALAQVLLHDVPALDPLRLPELLAQAGVTSKLLTDGALVLGHLTGIVLHVGAPLLFAGAFLAWLAGWVWHASRPGLLAVAWTAAAAAGLLLYAAGDLSLWGAPLALLPALLVLLSLTAFGTALGRTFGRRAERAAPHRPASDEPYLQKLLTARLDAAPKTAVRRQLGGVRPDFGDLELGKVVHSQAGLEVRWGRQKSLDRPVLVWLENSPTTEGPLPGVAVDHPDVLKLHALGQAPQGCFLTTEPVPGVVLADLLDRRGLAPPEAVGLAARMAGALQAFHDQGACHGRLGPEWVLVHGDLEPSLCPCGVPSPGPEACAADVRALGRLLGGWLPPRPRGWRRRAGAPLYRVADAAGEGQYQRAADLADDLGRAAGAARMRWRERWANVLLLVLLVLPLLAVLGFRLLAAAGSAPYVPGQAAFAGAVFLGLCPAAAVFGYAQTRVLIGRRRLRFLGGAGNVAAGAWLAGVARPLVPMLLLLALFLWPGLLIPTAEGSWGGLTLVLFGELAGFAVLGACLAGAITCVEVLVRSLRGS